MNEFTIQYDSSLYFFAAVMIFKNLQLKTLLIYDSKKLATFIENIRKILLGIDIETIPDLYLFISTKNLNIDKKYKQLVDYLSKPQFDVIFNHKNEINRIYSQIKCFHFYCKIEKDNEEWENKYLIHTNRSNNLLIESLEERNSWPNHIYKHLMEYFTSNENINDENDVVKFNNDSLIE
jgi:hypothetical protein